MTITREELARRIQKRANVSGESLTDAGALALANDDFFSGLFSVTDPAPAHDEQIAERIEDYFKGIESD